MIPGFDSTGVPFWTGVRHFIVVVARRLKYRIVFISFSAYRYRVPLSPDIQLQFNVHIRALTWDYIFGLSDTLQCIELDSRSIFISNSILVWPE